MSELLHIHPKQLTPSPTNPRRDLGDLLELCAEAISYVLSRAQHDADLGYYLGPGTEAYSRLCRAEAAVLGRSADDVEADRGRSFTTREPRAGATDSRTGWRMITLDNSELMDAAALFMRPHCPHCLVTLTEVDYDRETRTCSGALPKIRQRSEIEDCGQDGVCKLSPGCNRHWEERNRELLRENEVLRSNSDHLSSENASLARQVESMAMRIESLAEELAKPEDVRLREVLDALDGRAVIFDGLGVRVTHLLDEMDEWIARAGAAERRLKKAEEVVMLARQLTAYSWEDRLEDCEVSDAAKHDSRELGTAIWFYDQEEKS